jgi:SAM-dependent methyltransferase
MNAERANVHPAIWHDVECGAYSADLPLWEELADAAGEGPVLELGCGTGRVALHLARRGHTVWGVDRDPELLAALAERAADLPVTALCADVREFDAPESVALALAPMQVLQLLPGAADRQACLARVAAAMPPGRRFAAAIVESMPEPVDAVPPLPDVREVDGWVYSSLPLDAALDGEEIVIRRLRELVSPVGELSEETDEIRIVTLSASQIEREARGVGLRPLGRHSIPPTEIHVGSTVVVLEMEG